MRAVNLIPAEQRRGGGAGAAGRSGGAAYVVLGFLALAVVGVTALVLASNSVGERQAQLVQVKHDTEVAQARATSLKAYADFAQLEHARVKTVESIAGTRFDWERTMRDLSRVLPANAWLTSVLGTVKPGVTVDGGSGSGDTSSLRQSQPVPAIEMVGCTTTQGAVARLLSSLRLVRGVTRVSLASSEKSSAPSAPGAALSGTSGGGGVNDADCRHGSAAFPKFSLVIFFTPVASASAPAAAAPGAPATASATATTPAPGATTAPAPSSSTAAPAPASPGASR